MKNVPIEMIYVFLTQVNSCDIGNQRSAYFVMIKNIQVTFCCIINFRTKYNYQKFLLGNEGFVPASKPNGMYKLDM